jgi:hypothetical protein
LIYLLNRFKIWIKTMERFFDYFLNKCKCICCICLFWICNWNKIFDKDILDLIIFKDLYQG